VLAQPTGHPEIVQVAMVRVLTGPHIHGITPHIYALYSANPKSLQQETHDFESLLEAEMFISFPCLSSNLQ
jgi:hypothetical protein